MALPRVHHAERFKPFVQAMRNATGNAGRVHFITIGDSTQFITPTKYDGSGAEYATEPGGQWEGIIHAFLDLGFTCWGSCLSNVSDNNFNSFDSTSWSLSYQDFCVDAYTNASLTANRSFPTGNPAFNGRLQYVPTGGPYPVGAAWNYSCCITLRATPYPSDPRYTWYAGATTPNRNMLGDPTGVGHKIQYSYAIPVGGCNMWVCGITAFSAINGTPKHYTASTGGAMVDDEYQLNPVDLPNDRVFQLTNFGSNQSVGPFLLSGVQIVRNDVSLSSPNTGVGGFAVSVLWARGGYTMSHFNSELAYSIATYPDCLKEYLRTATRSADRAVICVELAGNDLNGASPGKAFIYGTDTGTLDGATFVGTSGANRDTYTGIQQNAQSLCTMIENAWLALGKSLSNLLIVFGPYHPRYDPTGTQSQTASGLQMFEQAIIDWCDSATATNNTRVVVIRNSRCASTARMWADKWYNGVGQNDTAHLSVAGFRNYCHAGIAALVSEAEGFAFEPNQVSEFGCRAFGKPVNQLPARP